MANYKNSLGESELFGRMTAGFAKICESVQSGKFVRDEMGVICESVCEDEENNGVNKERTSFESTCRELGLDDVGIETVWEKAADVVQTAMGDGFEGDIEAWESMDADEFAICVINASGHAEFDGIGPYEYWGQKCYDKGDVYIETNEIDYSEGDVLNALAEIGMSADLQDVDDVDIDWGEPDEDYGTCSGTLNVKGRFVVTDKAKFAEWVRNQM